MAAATGAHRAGRPVITALVATGSLALVLLPAAAELLVYDRSRVLGGEAWRLVTGHAVHFSLSHAAWNLVLFSVAGVWIERRNRRQLGWLIALTALAGGMYVPAFMPDMVRYGGLSGVVSAMIVYLSLHEARRGGVVQLVWATILVLFAAKVGYEILVGDAMFAAPEATRFQVVPAVHIIGATVAVGVFCFSGSARPAAVPSSRNPRKTPVHGVVPQVRATASGRPPQSGLQGRPFNPYDGTPLR